MILRILLAAADIRTIGQDQPSGYFPDFFEAHHRIATAVNLTVGPMSPNTNKKIWLINLDG
jgi:hypothetical protein